MSVKSKKSAKKIDRPFDREVWKHAKAVARQYQIIVGQEDDQWFGRGLELPNVFGDGKTATQCMNNTREALAVAVAFLLEEGQRPPVPANLGRRTMQVNIRVTAEEKALLESTAKRQGYRAVSEYMRTAAIAMSGK
jgi:predicted RNase H-like HicB family nuclease